MTSSTSQASSDLAHIISDNIVREYLIDLLPSGSSHLNDVVAWVKGKDFKVAGLESLTRDDLVGLTREQKDALAETVYDAYCRARGISRVYAPENLQRALDMVAYRFHFADRHAMREHNEKLYSDVVGRLETFSWRNQYLARQTLDDKDLEFAVNTWFARWREGWSDGQKEFFNARQTEHVQWVSKTYTPGELFEAVQEFLSTHPGQEYGYNKVADGLGIAKPPLPGAVAQRMKVKDALERLSNGKQNIYEDVVRYVTRPNKKGAKSATVYTWAPQRRRLDREKSPILRRGIIKDVILEFVAAHPDCSQAQIKEGVRAALAQIDNAKVIEVLGEMITGRLIGEPRRGAHNTYIYRVAEVVNSLDEDDAPRAFNLKDIFGLDAERETVPKTKTASKKPWEFDEEAMMRIASNARRKVPV